MLYDYSVFIGRFQPFHKGHSIACKQAFQQSKHLIILVGSAFAAPNIRNPFTFEQRKELLTSNLNEQGYEGRFTILPIRDFYYSDDSWIAQVQQQVGSVVDSISTVALVGHKKDHTSYYLDLFPKWDFLEIDGDFTINATDIRRAWFEDLLNTVQSQLPELTHQFLSAVDTIQFKNLQEEYKEIKAYKEAWSAAPYPPTFVTTDAVVTCCGHILLITRKSHPGKGLYALPGGFINQNERLRDGCLRELKEETRIKIPLPVLEGSIVAQNVFDHPLRSVRGRTITHAFYIQLKDKELPKVKGSDDAVSAAWHSLSWLQHNTDKLFEDHAQIIDSFIGRGVVK